MTDLHRSNIVIWPKWCFMNNPMEHEPQDLVISNNNNNLKDNNNFVKEKLTNGIQKIKRKYKKENRQHSVSPKNPNSGIKDPNSGVNGYYIGKAMPSDAGSVKSERLSPDTGSEAINNNNKGISPSPSISPKSPISHRTRTPSFAGTPPNPAFTPPTYDRFSPAALANMGSLPPGIAPSQALKQSDNYINRNCSDIMRSLAAKYNNSNPNDYFSSPTNTLRPSLMPSYKSSPSPFAPPNVSNSRDIDKKPESIVSNISTSVLPQGLPPNSFFPGASIPGFPGFPLVDMSSTQVLLNMVRNASTTQQSNLENYIKNTLKRPAESSPLDLSSVANKKPRLDINKAFDVKSLFQIPQNDEERRLNDNVTISPVSHSPVIPSSFNHISAKPNHVNNSPTLSPNSTTKPSYVGLPCSDQNCPSLSAVQHWTVDDVYNFVSTIDLCAEYAEVFREQRIDGSALPLLTEEHLTNSINMKLGPALKLRSVLARKLGCCSICLHCSHCHNGPADRRPNSTSSGQ